ncbi:MAG TPA: 1,6-anhydro-N-acetylmuramyl-L-alanine amidase AmpD [Gammaproteobacteria bacterium]
MMIDAPSGLLVGARQVSSPNCDERPAGSVPELIVIHAISLPPGQFGGPWIDALFTNTLDPAAHPYFAEIHHLQVSSHLLLRRDGEIVQYVPFGKRAWHAGKSHYAGRERCNDFSIGIELEGSDDTPFELAQYHQLAAVIGALLRTYPTLDASRITGHSDIAPGRKTDPGPHFLWPQLYALLEQGMMNLT